MNNKIKKEVEEFKKRISPYVNGLEIKYTEISDSNTSLTDIDTGDDFIDYINANTPEENEFEKEQLELFQIADAPKTKGLILEFIKVYYEESVLNSCYLSFNRHFNGDNCPHLMFKDIFGTQKVLCN